MMKRLSSLYGNGVHLVFASLSIWEASRSTMFGPIFYPPLFSTSLPYYAAANQHIGFLSRTMIPKEVKYWKEWPKGRKQLTSSIWQDILMITKVLFHNSDGLTGSLSGIPDSFKITWHWTTSSRIAYTKFSHSLLSNCLARASTARLNKLWQMRVWQCRRNIRQCYDDIPNCVLFWEFGQRS